MIGNTESCDTFNSIMLLIVSNIATLQEAQDIANNWIMELGGYLCGNNQMPIYLREIECV